MDYTAFLCCFRTSFINRYLVDRPRVNALTLMALPEPSVLTVGQMLSFKCLLCFAYLKVKPIFIQIRWNDLVQVSFYLKDY